METQVQGNPKVVVPANGKVIVSGDEYEDSMIDMDDFDLAKIFTPNINMDLSPTPSPAMVEQIDGLLAKGKTFRSLNDKYVEKFVVKGNEELYELLGSVYGFMLTVNESPYRDHILKRMREYLSEEHSIILQESTAIESVVVRFVVPSDRQTAFNYARVMKVAFIEKIAAKDLAGYIKGRGGITKIQDTLANEEAAKEAKEIAKKKLSLFKKLVLASGKTITDTVEIPIKRMLDLVSAGKKESYFEFAIVDSMDNKNYRIHQVISVPETVGEQWLNYISQAVLSDDVDSIQNNLDKLRERLGITNGYGMLPGDKGYIAAGGVTQQPEKQVEEEIEAKE